MRDIEGHHTYCVGMNHRRLDVAIAGPLSSPDGALPRCHALAVMPTPAVAEGSVERFALANGFPTACPARIGYPEVAAAAMAIFQAALVLAGNPVTSVNKSVSCVRTAADGSVRRQASAGDAVQASGQQQLGSSPWGWMMASAFERRWPPPE